MKKNSGFLILVFVLTAVFNYGCKKGTAPVSPAAPPSALATPKDIVEDYVPEQNKYNTVSSCPVTGEKITVDKNTLAAKYNGRIYYFCCPACVSKFKAEPKRYAK